MRPDLLLLVDTATGLVADSSAVAPTASDTEAAQWAAEVVGKTPSFGLRPPQRLRVEGEGLAVALRGLVGDGVTVVAGEAPEAEEPLAAMAEASARAHDKAPQSHLDEDLVSAEAVGAFFEAAAVLFPMAPWEVVRDSQAVEIDAPGLGRPGACACVIGALGENLGLVVFESLADYVAFNRLADESPAERAPRHGPGVPMFSIGYERTSAVPRGLSREAKAHGWPLAGKGAFPSLLAVDTDGLVRPLVDADYAFAAACLRAMASFYETHRDVFEAVDPPPVTEEYETDGARVRITAPHPDAGWSWGDETALDPIYRQEAMALVEAFGANLRTQGRPGAWIEVAESQVAQLLSYRLDEGDPPGGFTAGEIREYLIDFLPRKVDVPEDEVELVPDCLLEYFRWLAQTGREPPGRMADVRSEIERRRRAFEREARNPARYGPAKTLMTHMRQAGVDLEDEGAVHRFMDEFNERLKDDPSLLPDLGPAPARPRKTWVWNAAEPPPDPAAPCPCGSGRRYKKCCRPR